MDAIGRVRSDNRLDKHINIFWRINEVEMPSVEMIQYENDVRLTFDMMTA